MTTSDDVTVGTPLPGQTVDVDAQRMKTMAALLRDPNPIHLDPEAVAALGLGDRPVNQGPVNLGYVMNVLLAWADGDPGRIRRVTVRFLGNVLAGDRVHAGGEVRAVTEVGSVPVATCEVWLDRDDGTRLLTGTAEVVCG
jgi:acyl dehydratase